MKVLLLGGTGAMGVHLTDILSKQYTVTVTSRRMRSPKNNVEYIQGNAKDLNFLNSILKEKWDVIIDFMVYSTEEFSERVNLFLKSTDQYIFLSSARVYDSFKTPMKENFNRLAESSKDSVFLDTDDYALAKARQEDILKSSKMVNWTIIRPYITYSQSRLQLGSLEQESWLYRSIKGRTIVFSKDICEHFTTLTYGYDVSYGISKLVNNKNALGEAFHITSNICVRWEKVLNLYLEVLEKHLGKRPKILFQNLPEFMEWNSNKYKIIYDRLFDRKFDNSKIIDFVDVESFTSPEDGLKMCLNEFLKNPEFRNINWAVEGRQDRLTKERTPFKEIEGIKNKLRYIKYRYLCS